MDNRKTSPRARKIDLKGRKFKVVGVLIKRGEDALVNFYSDDIILLPYNAARKFLNLENEGRAPLISVVGKEDIPAGILMEEIRGVMRAVRKLKPIKEDNFALNQASAISSQVQVMFGVINMVGWIIGSFSVLVGGFGVANIMFVSVKERTNIIGIKKALGAKSYLLLLEFLIESIILSVLGGGIGLLLVFSVTMISTYMLDFEFFLSVSNMFWGIMIAVIVGAVAGFWPARTASRMEPVAAIQFK